MPSTKYSAQSSLKFAYIIQSWTIYQTARLPHLGFLVDDLLMAPNAPNSVYPFPE